MHPVFEVSEISFCLLVFVFQSRSVLRIKAVKWKPLHIFLEELKRKSEDDFRNSSVDKNTRSTEIEISKRTKNLRVFQRQKR